VLVRKLASGSVMGQFRRLPLFFNIFSFFFFFLFNFLLFFPLLALGVMEKGGLRKRRRRDPRNSLKVERVMDGWCRQNASGKSQPSTVPDKP
jgi:hypothetical protein